MHLMDEHEASPEENRIIALLISKENVLMVMAQGCDLMD